MKRDSLWLYKLKHRNAAKTYCKRHDIDHDRTTLTELERVGRFYAKVTDGDTVTGAAFHYEKHGYIVFSKLFYFDAFVRLELKVLCRLVVENKVVYAVLTNVNKFETVEIYVFENGRTGIKRGYLEI